VNVRGVNYALRQALPQFACGKHSAPSRTPFRYRAKSVRLPTGMVFAFRTESRSPSIGFPTQRLADGVEPLLSDIPRHNPLSAEELKARIETHFRKVLITRLRFAEEPNRPNQACALKKGTQCVPLSSPVVWGTNQAPQSPLRQGLVFSTLRKSLNRKVGTHPRPPQIGIFLTNYGRHVGVGVSDQRLPGEYPQSQLRARWRSMAMECCL
jgi:hypothetical protein